MPIADRPRPSLSALWLPVAAYTAIIFALSSISTTPEMPAGSDKVLHTLLYSGLGLLVARARAGGMHAVTMRAVGFSIVFGAIYGISDELHQYFNPPRNVEVGDVVADTVGAALGAGALYAWSIIRGRDGL